MLIKLKIMITRLNYNILLIMVLRENLVSEFSEEEEVKKQGMTKATANIRKLPTSGPPTKSSHKTYSK